MCGVPSFKNNVNSVIEIHHVYKIGKCVLLSGFMMVVPRKCVAKLVIV